MPLAHATLHRLLVSLVRRERRLLVIQAALQGLGAVGLVLLLAVALHALRLPRALALTALGVAAALLPTAALLLPASLRWRASGDPVRQAGLVEALRPDLRGRLVTIAERPEGPLPGESEALLGLAASRALQRVEGLEPVAVHPSGPARRALAGLGVVALLCMLSSLGPAGPLVALDALLGVGQGRAVAAGGPEAARREEALLGDIVLRYRYPDYTGLEPLEVPNSTGDVHGPPGTIVELAARAAEPWQSAELILERDATADLPASTLREPAALDGGRDLRASFELSAPGGWSFALRNQAGEQRSQRHGVVLDLDQPPELLLMDAEGLLEVAWDERVPVSWTARDDYGLVHVEVVLSEGDVRSHSLRKPLDPARRLEGGADFVPADLGLMPGAEARLQIRAWDNDAIGGSKAGTSPSFRVRVLGPRGQTARRRRVVRELRDALLLVLADHLEDPWPMQAERTALRRWGAASARRMDPVELLVEDAWQGYEPEGFEGTVLEAVRRSQASLVGFANALGPGEGSVQAVDLETAGALRLALIRDLEQGVLTLDLVVRQIARQALVERVQGLDQAASRLEAQRDAGPGIVLSRLDRLARQLDQVELAATEMGDSNLAQFSLYRVRDLRHLSSAVRDAHAAERDEQGRAYQDRLVRELRSFAEQFEQLEQRQRELDDAIAERMKALHEEITSMLAAQTGLLEQLFAAVQSAGDPAQALRGRWDRLAEAAQELSSSLEALGATMMAHEGRPASEWRLALQASAEAERLGASLEARDLGRALEDIAETEWSLQRLGDNVQRHAEHAQLLDRAVPGQPEVERSLSQAGGQATRLRESLEALLQQLAAEPAQLRAATDALTARQDALQQRAEAAEIEARDLVGQLPMEAPGLVEGLGRAEDEMTRAEDALPRGYAREAEGSQRAAIQGLEEALEALEQAMQNQQDMSNMSQCEDCQGGGGQGEGEGARKGDQRQSKRARVEIPTPEEFRTPEAYRQALLEGMQAEVPPEYQALERRYYEDLVRQ
jgi:hypothetical protein